MGWPSHMSIASCRNTDLKQSIKKGCCLELLLKNNALRLLPPPLCRAVVPPNHYLFGFHPASRKAEEVLRVLLIDVFKQVP